MPIAGIRCQQADLADTALRRAPECDDLRVERASHCDLDTVGARETEGFRERCGLLLTLAG
jgi:hypothetical protein